MKRDAATAELSREELEAEVAALRSENAQLRTAPLPPLNPLPPLAPLPAFDPLASPPASKRSPSIASTAGMSCWHIAASASASPAAWSKFASMSLRSSSTFSTCVEINFTARSC